MSLAVEGFINIFCKLLAQETDVFFKTFPSYETEVGGDKQKL